MWKRLLRRDSRAGIAAVLLSASSFIAQFKLEGWVMQLEYWITFPGVISPLLAIMGLSLIVYNFFKPYYSYEQKKAIERRRKPLLGKLDEAIDVKNREL